MTTRRHRPPNAKRTSLITVVFINAVFVFSGIGTATHQLWGQGSSTLPAAGQPSIGQYKEQLQSSDLQVRRQAAIAIRTADTETRKALLPLFVEGLRGDSDGQFRLAIFDALTEMGPDAEAAVEVLVYSMRKNFGGRYNEELHQDYRAALALAAIGKPAVGPLRELLSEESTHLRAEATMALGRIGPDAVEAAGDLIGLLSDSSERLRRDAVDALAAIGSGAVDALLAAADDKDPNVRAGAIAAIGKMNLDDRRCAALIQTAMNDDQPLVRVAAIRSIGASLLDEPSRRECLEQNLQHDDARVRLAVIDFAIGQTELIRTLQPELLQMLVGSNDGVADHAAFLLQELGTDAIEPLLSAASHPHSRLDQIGQAIARIGTAAVDSLHDAIANANSRIRQAAAMALGEIRPVASGTIDLLAAGLNSPDTATQAACLAAIGNLGRNSTAAVPTVRKLLGDQSADIRDQAITVLVQAAPRDEMLVENLMTLIDDPQAEIQQHAMDAIRVLGPIGRRAIPAATEKLASETNQVRLSAAALVASHGAGAESALPTLTEQLAQADGDWQLVLIDTIGNLGSSARPALDPLVALLNDPDASVRTAALQAISSLGLEPMQMLPLLAKALADEQSDVRSRALRVTRQLGRSANELLPNLIPLAADEDHRRSVNRVLERLEKYDTPPSAIAPLTDLLASDDKHVRQLAARFLGLAGPAAKQSLAAIRELLNASDPEVRDAATSAIEKIEAK